MRVQRTRRTWSIYAPGAVAALLLSYSAFHGVPGVVVQNGVHMVANVVGATASVPVTPENRIAAQLALRETELDTREELVGAREDSLSFQERVLPFASFVASIVLALLVALNFYMDFRRTRAPRGVVNLSRS